MKHTVLLLLFCCIYSVNLNAQFFPNPVTLATGQGTPGNIDPLWLCSPWSTGIPGNPMSEVYGPTLINNNCAPGSWISPSSLASPMNNGNWITGTENDCSTNTTSGYRYFRLPINLPPDCNGNSVTVAGNYVLNLDGYVDNTIVDVFINGNSQGISGGTYTPGGQLSINLVGPWAVGNNYIDILVRNAPSNGVNPYGLFLVANDLSTANTDSDNDGVSNLLDACPCDFGTNAYGCNDALANTCDIDLIRSTFIGAGCQELPVCQSECSMYFYNPAPNTGNSAQAFAQSFGANLISIQSAAENACIRSELARLNLGGIVWIGFNDIYTPNNYVWYDQSPVVYTNWAGGEPNNNNGIESCTQIFPNGQWNDLNCNSSNAKSIIEVNLCPVITTQDITICINEPANITVSNPILGSNPYNFIWNNGVTTQSQTVPSVSSTNIVTVFDRYNCSVSDTVNVIVKPLPVIAPMDTIICTGGSTNVNITANYAATTFTWTVSQNNVTGASNGSGNTIVQTLTATATTGGNAVYTITPTLNGCVGNPMNVTVDVAPLPVISAGADVIICSTDSTTITATGGVTYDWDNGLGSGISHTVAPNSPTTYIVTGTDANGCVSADTVNVGLFISPTATMSIDTSSVCLNGVSPIITFSGSLGVAPYTFNYSLNGIPYTIVSNATGVATVNLPTAVSGNLLCSLTGVTDTKSCNVPLSLNEVLTVFALPTLISPAAKVCFGSTVNLSVSGAFSYVWSPAANLSTSTGDTVVFTAGNSCSYVVTGTDTNGCVNDTTMFVTVIQLPIIDAGTEVHSCIGSQTTLTATGAGIGGNYVWNDPAVVNGVPFPVVMDSTIYHVIGTDTNGCKNVDSVIVAVQAPPVVSFTAVQKGFCYPVTVTFTNTSPASQNCVWTMDNGATFTGCGPVDFVLNQSGVFGATLSVESTYGCAAVMHQDSLIFIDEYPIAAFHASNYTPYTTYPYVEFSNNSQHATSYNWNFGDGSLNTTDSVPTHLFPLNEVANYEVTLTAYSINDCVDTAVSIIRVIEDLVFFVPNTFTPDGNEYNNTFGVVIGSGIDVYSFSLVIYNRWGEKIWESFDPSVYWDGSFKGKIVQDGSYTWKLDFNEKSNGKHHQYSGGVNVIH